MQVWHIPPPFCKELPVLKPLHARPRHLTVLPTNPEEQERRILAIDLVKQLVVRYGFDVVCQWCAYASAELAQPLPCQRTEEQP